MPHQISTQVRALTFDIFGTVVDWHGSIATEVARLQLPTDGGRFALDWRAGYQPAMQEVRSACCRGPISTACTGAFLIASCSPMD